VKRILARVIRHRLHEIDREILTSRDPREVRKLWTTRRRLLRIRHALIGIVK
jgi:hypothetical protein